MVLPEELYCEIFKFLNKNQLSKVIVILKLSNKNNLCNLAIEHYGKKLKYENIYTFKFFRVFTNLSSINSFESYLQFIVEMNRTPYISNNRNKITENLKVTLELWETAIKDDKERKKFRNICRHTYKYICI